MDFVPSQNDVAQYQRPQGRKMSHQTIKQREIAIRAKFAKQWAKDEDQKACFQCLKEFNFLYRRRHHCRKCALVYCSTCSNYFLSQLIDPFGPIDKDTRLCQRCFLECKQFMESDNKNNVDDEDSISSDDEEEPEPLKILNKIEYKDQFEIKLKNLIRFIFQQEKKLSSVPNFCDQYIERTFSFTLYCLKNLRSRIKKQEGDNRVEKFYDMDINRYVIIKTSLHKDANQFNYINGIINSKNVAKKNMYTQFGPKKDVMSSVLSNNQLKNSSNSSFDGSSQGNNGSAQSPLAQGVRCMVISVSVDIFSFNDNNYPDLQQVIQKQRMYVQRIVEGIKQFKPQIIFCKENVNQDVLTQLEQEKITVVQKIKNDIILKIAECARCLIVDDITIILPSNPNQSSQKISNQLTKSYIGNLYSVYFKTYQFATRSKTFMFLVQPEKSTAYHVSLLITGPELEILRQFKKNLQVILRLARHLYLEQEIIYTNNEMIKGNKKAKKLYIQSLENDYVDFGNLNNFIDDKIGLGDYLYSDNSKFTYVKIQYKKVEWDQFDGVGSKEEFEKYTSDKRINYENMKINTLVKYCGEFGHEQVSFYQVNDLSLAEFLFTIYKERNTACLTCERPMYNHYQLFVRNKCYVRLSIVERMDPNIAKQAKENSIQSRTKTEQGLQIVQQKSQQPSSQPSKAQGDEQLKYHQYQYHNQQRIPSRSPQKQQVEGLKKCKLHPKEPVLQYILCEQCNQNITTVHKSMIGKTLIDYSFNRFLQHMFQEHSEQYKKDKQNCLKDIKEQKDVNTGQSTVVINKCTHQVRSRIFNIKDVEIKFQIGRTNVHSFNKISFIPEQVQVSIRECDAMYYKEAYQNFKVFFKVMISDALARFTKLHDIVYQKKTSKQQAFFNIIEMYRICIERMESEKEHIISQIDIQKITNYTSVILLYILEQRMNIGLNRLNTLQKEIIKKKFKQFEKQHLDETIHSDLDNSILDDDFQDLKEIDQANKFKGYTTTLNAQEERLKDDQQTQPFEYIPVYQKNQLSMMAWALNTKQYCRFLKDVGLYGQKVSRSTLTEMLKKKNLDPNLDEKQKIEENKIIVKLIKSQEIEILVRHDQYFQNLMITPKDSQLELSKVYSTQDPQIVQRAGSDHHRSQSHHNNLNNDHNHLLVPAQFTHSQQQSADPTPELVQIKIKDEQNKENNDISNMEDQISEQQQQQINPNDNSQSGDESISSKNNLAEQTLPKKQIKQSNSGNNIRENLNNLFYKNGESKSSQNNLVEFGQNHEAKNSVKENIVLTPSSNQQTPNQIPTHSHSSNNIGLLNLNHTVPHRLTHQSVTSNPYNTSICNNSVATNFQTELEQSNVYRIASSNQNMGGSGSIEKISEIHILFAKQFEAFRNLHGISQERIIESLRTCAVVKLPGGQTQSVFVKSHDELFVVKEVSQLEFNYFQAFALQYFDHMSSNSNSLLSKIFGIFMISNEGEKIRYYAVMENLFYGIDKESCQSYDLKGSKKRRFMKGTDIGLDTNFMIDMNCEPFFIDNSTYQQFDKTIRSDSDFLAQQDVVDYSLLLIVDRNKKCLRLGIIDYFRKFDLTKLVEKQIKGFIYGEDPTIIEPKKYQERFVKTLTKRFFCKV